MSILDFTDLYLTVVLTNIWVVSVVGCIINLSA